MRKKRSTPALPFMLLELAANAGETIARRSWMMASGKCSPAEYRRMITEKVKATQQTGVAMLSKGSSIAKLVKPWHVGAQRNVKRLRRRKG